MSKKSPQQFDMQGELVSGDPNRQSRALLAVLGLLSAGREVGSHVSLICQAILGNASVGSDIRCTAYDVVTAAMPSDTDCARISAAIIADVQKGSTAEVRVKALHSIALLPSHRLLGMLSNEHVRERFGAVLRSPSPPVRAAAIEAVNGLVFSDAVAAAAYYVHPSSDSANGGPSIDNALATPRSSSAALGVALGVSALLSEAVASAGEGLIDDDSGVVVASCHAMNSLLQAAATSTSGPGEDSGAGAGATEPPSSENAKAAVVRKEMGLAAVAAVDEAFPVATARFRSLPAMIQCETPAVLCTYLKAIQVKEGARPLDALPGDEGGARRHAFEETASFLAELVRGGDPPSVLAAAQGLFELAEMDAASATVQALLPSAIAAAIGASTATSARSHERAVAQHAVLHLLLRHLDVLPSVQRAALFSRLPPIMAAMPAALDRVKSFYLLWSAVAAFDWNTNALTRNNNSGSGGSKSSTAVVPTPQLQLLLLDPHLKEAISGVSSTAATNSTSSTSTAGPPPHERYQDPIFREEVVGTLLYVLLTHPRPAAVTGDDVAAASSAVAQASVLQAASAAVDWLVTAKLTLQGTKACLGWDRMAGVQTTGSTAAADLWLQLLLRCIHLGKMLKVKLGPTAARHAQAMATAAQAASSAAAAAAGGGDGGTPPPAPVAAVPVDPGTAALAALVRRASELEGETQGLLLQIAANWRALHPVVRPRAVWLCACHLRLRNVVDGAWTSLADAVHGLLADARAARDVGGVSGYMASVTEGSLKIKESSVSGGIGRHEAGVAAGAGESEEVALLSLERLAGLVTSNHQGRLEGHLADVATLLEKLIGVSQNSGLLNLSPSAEERLMRVGEALKPVSTAGKRHSASHTAPETGQNIPTTTISLKKSTALTEGGGGGGPSKNDGPPSSGPVVVELVHIESTSHAAVASYPSTLPTAAALFGVPESTRYRMFLEQLQAAALEKSIAAGGGAAAVTAAAHARGRNSNQSSSNTTSASSPSGGLPTLQQLTEALEGGTGNGGSISSTSSLSVVEVTGAAAPVTLSLSHIVDPGAGSIRLRCSATNKTKQALSGVAVTLLLGGPVAGGARKPLVYRLNTLSAGETSSWEVPLRVNGFGWPVIQPAVTLPAQTPAGFQPTLRCRPYAVSPLQLLAPVARAMSPAEFYQRWQAMPHKACVAAAPAESGPLGLLKVLAAVEGAGLTCVMKAVVPVAGGVHAAFNGSAWSGESIAVVVTSSAESSNRNSAGGGATGAASEKKRDGSNKTVLHLHFGSEASEVVAHIRGHEADLLAQLTRGAAVPAVGASADGGGDGDGLAATSGAAEASAPEEDRPSSISTFSFLRSVALQMDAGGMGGGDEEDEDAAEKEAAIQKETNILQGAALTQWKKVHALRVL